MRIEIDGIRGLPLAERAAALSSAHGILARALDDDAALDELGHELARAVERAAALADGSDEAAGEAGGASSGDEPAREGQA